MKGRIVFALLTILAATCMQASANDSQISAVQKMEPTQLVGPEFVIGLEDVLAVNVWKDPELSIREAIVRPDGRISLPLVGDIQANGRTVRQLQEAIADKLREFITSPVVTVTVIRISSQSVSIVGQVGKPGVYPMGAPMTVMELLARAGGVTSEAKTKKIKILRNEEGKTRTFAVNYNEIVAGKNLSQNIPLKSGDMVVVP